MISIGVAATVGLLIIIGTVVFGLLDGDREDMFPHLVLSTFVSIVVLVFIIAVTVSEPSALDVYQGKTTLRITYDNNVPVDTVVIYKK